jgi:hypothetical protein
MFRKLLLPLALATLVGVTGLLLTPSDASAGWRRGYHHRHHFVHRPHFVHRAHFGHRRHFVHRHHYVRPVYYRRAFIAPVAYGPSCIIKRKVRWTRWGHPVRIIKKICY